jgi:lipoprotein-anchoring transpeptidase ErfK/SrfK
MKSIFSSQLLRCCAMFFTATILTLTTLGVELTPAVADSLNERITEKITTLKSSGERWIQVDLKKQRLFAWEGNTQVYAVIISSGKEATPTLPGVFTIQSKHPQARMRGDDYDLPDVPFVMFYEGSYGIHGTYWHRNFGTPVSHGCVNLAVDQARWLFNWASVGTPVVVTN